jgi:hypothetical protein
VWVNVETLELLDYGQSSKYIIRACECGEAPLPLYKFPTYQFECLGSFWSDVSDQDELLILARGIAANLILSKFAGRFGEEISRDPGVDKP